MSEHRIDETWHRLRDWTLGQSPSERLAAQVLIFEGYKSVNPSHPLGGKFAFDAVSEDLSIIGLVSTSTAKTLPPFLRLIRRPSLCKRRR